MENTSKDFSIIMPILGTKEELEFMKKTVPAIINLNPHEIIFGIDAPEDQNLITILDQICNKNGFDRQRYVTAKHDKNWNMQLCHIIWNCVAASKNDKMFMINVDSLVFSSIMTGYDIVGTLNIAAHSSPTKHYVKTIRDRIKAYSHKLFMNKISETWSGVFWIYRPYFLECINLVNYKKIYNGADEFVFDSIEKNKKYKYVCNKQFNNKALTYENNDLHWRQFLRGIYMYAQSRNETQINSGLIKYMKIFLHRFPNIGIRFYSWLFIWPYFFKGYQWASKHNEHKIVQLAKEKSRAEWSHYGSTLINDVYDWEKIGKTGTGFTKK